MEDPFNRTNITRNMFAVSVLRRLLGSNMELKSLHAMFALSYLNGTRDQHWHRDTGLLWDPDDDFHVPDTHARMGGMHEPPYALNCFIALSDMQEKDGPTEFILGSHMWASTWFDDEQDDCCEDYKFTGMPPGSIVIADYRTVHRGTINLGTNPRPLAMYIYGREWWTDTVNYGRGDYGGLKATPAEQVRRLLPITESATIPSQDLQVIARAYLRTHDTLLANDAEGEKAALAELLLELLEETQEQPSDVEAGDTPSKPAITELLQKWKVSNELQNRAAAEDRQKMFKGMLAKWGESLQSEVSGTVHLLPKKYASRLASAADAHPVSEEL